jgi:outer membrane receptor protein involved in Fe transport
LSADYYDIDLKDAIAALSTQNIANLCTQGNAQFCGFFTYDAAGNPTSVTSRTLNLAHRQNTGIDFVASYNREMDDLLPGTPGRISVQFGATWVMDAINDPGAGALPIQLAGMANTGGIPRFRTNTSVSWTTDRFSITGQMLTISASRQDNTWNTLPSLTINDNKVRAITYFNAFGSYDITDRIEVSAQVYNLLDKDPPPVPYPVLLQPTNGVWYDKVGRTYQVGIKYHF